MPTDPTQPTPPQPDPAPVPTPKPSQTVNKLDMWCLAAIAMEGAYKPNNNPGNVRYIPGTWPAKLATGNRRGFCTFKTYNIGYAVLKKIFTNACTGLSKIYHPTDTLYTFYEKYAPASDGNNPKKYAEYVSSIIKVDPNVQIQTLLS